ncbi:FixH family protein [Tenacibaculum sp. IB213877]|uniref:FixH family protein n=1 Tax=Tenacibaculum sp. IB213877 TaxID=3097351 RepID=UPI002A5A6F79|nr:FixH family protein [Tenacibaculum sp. IB213877]MDY0781405.1 FixH family protein [Tenacibaculum sp. IB213877]
MKFNWGTGIVIAIMAFIGFIMFMVVTMITDKNYDHDLVTEKYYQKELSYQKNIDAIKNAKNLEHPVELIKTNEGLKVLFPSNFNPTEIKGKVFLYRPSNKKLDFELPISISNPYLLVPENNLLGGRWNIEVSFNYKNKDYLVTKELIY